MFTLSDLYPHLIKKLFLSNHKLLVSTILYSFDKKYGRLKNRYNPEKKINVDFVFSEYFHKEKNAILYPGKRPALMIHQLQNFVSNSMNGIQLTPRQPWDRPI